MYLNIYVYIPHKLPAKVQLLKALESNFRTGATYRHATSTDLNEGLKSGTPSGKHVDWGSNINLSDFIRGPTSGLQRTCFTKTE